MSGHAFGVLGDPVAHSRSPAMHNAAFAQLGLPHRYFAWHVAPARLGDALAGASALGLGGLNLTVPHKQAALASMADLAPEARRIGAVNTVAIVGGRLVGHNTDAWGFARSLAELGGDPPRRAVVMGGGGAALAVLDALAHAFEPAPSVQWVRRTAGNGQVSYDALPDAMDGADLLVNATTVGMAGGPAAFPVDPPLAALGPAAKVVDLVYPGAATGLVARAQRAGISAQDGLPMLLFQGVRALEIWLEQELPEATIAAMRTAIS